VTIEEQNLNNMEEPMDEYIQYNNYMNRKTTNLGRSKTHSHDYNSPNSPNNLIYKNGNVMNNYNNINLNILNNYNEGINYYNQNNIKMNMNDFDNNNNILSKSSSDYYGQYSNLLMNKKNNNSNNIKINKDSVRKKFHDYEGMDKEINALNHFNENVDMNKDEEIKSKTKTKQKNQNGYDNNIYYNSNNPNKIRNQSAKDYTKYNHQYYGYNNEIIDNIDEYNKSTKNKNNYYSGTNSISNTNRNKNFIYESKSRKKNNDVNNHKNENKNSAKVNNIRTYKESYEYDSNDKGDKNKNIQNVKGINFNNINIGINNNNFIFDNNKAYQTYKGTFRSKPNKKENNINGNDILEINDIKDENIKDKNRNSMINRSDMKKGKFIIKTENDQNIDSNKISKSKQTKSNTNIMNKDNNINANHFYNSNTLEEKSSKYKVSLSENMYKLPDNYSKNITNNNTNNFNTSSNNNIFNKTIYNRKVSHDKNSEFFFSIGKYNNNFYEEISSTNKNEDNADNVNMEITEAKGINNNYNTFNNKTHLKSKSMNKYSSDNNNNVYKSKNNFIKSERHSNKKNINEDEKKKISKDYQIKLEKIKERTIDLLHIFSCLLENKISIINGNNGNNLGNNNNDNDSDNDNNINIIDNK